MSGIGEAFRTKLLSYSTVSAIVGQRMYPDALVQGAQLPAIAYYVTSTERDHTLEGLGRFASARFTVDCYAATRMGASLLSKAIRETGIDHFKGLVSGYTFDGIDFDSGDEYLNDSPIDGGQEHRYIVTFDLLVHYVEP